MHTFLCNLNQCNADRPENERFCKPQWTSPTPKHHIFIRYPIRLRSQRQSTVMTNPDASQLQMKLNLVRRINICNHSFSQTAFINIKLCEAHLLQATRFKRNISPAQKLWKTGYNWAIARSIIIKLKQGGSHQLVVLRHSKQC